MLYIKKTKKKKTEEKRRLTHLSHESSEKSLCGFNKKKNVVLPFICSYVRKRLGGFFIWVGKTKLWILFLPFSKTGEAVCAFVGVPRMNSAAENVCGCSVSDHDEEERLEWIRFLFCFLIWMCVCVYIDRYIYTSIYICIRMCVCVWGGGGSEGRFCQHTVVRSKLTVYMTSLCVPVITSQQLNSDLERIGGEGKYS